MTRQISGLRNEQWLEQCAGTIDGAPPPSFIVCGYPPKLKFELSVFFSPTRLEKDMRKATALTIGNQPVTQLFHAKLHRNLIRIPRVSIAGFVL